MAVVTKCVMNTCHRSAILVVHFIVGGAAVLVAKLGTTWSAPIYRGEWGYCTRSETFKDKARLQLHSNNVLLTYKAVKFKVVCVATRTLVMNCYSRDLLVLS